MINKWRQRMAVGGEAAGMSAAKLRSGSPLGCRVCQSTNCRSLSAGCGEAKIAKAFGDPSGWTGGSLKDPEILS
jgi:hypothetical protein